jgi:hypothetical protein
VETPVWQSLLHHRELLAHANFAGVRDALSSCFSKPPRISHVYFDEESTALGHPVLHMLRAEAQSERAREQLGDVMRRVVDRAGKTAFGGQSLERPTVYFVFIGATTVEVGVCLSRSHALGLKRLIFFFFCLAPVLLAADSARTRTEPVIVQWQTSVRWPTLSTRYCGSNLPREQRIRRSG